MSFDAGEAALRPTRVEAATPKGAAPALIGAKGKDGSGTITPGGKGSGGGPQLGAKSDQGFIAGPIAAGDHPRVFHNGGKVGTDTIYWSGGTGGRGNQWVSSVDVSPPNIEADESGGQAKAWVTPGTGTASVTRSFNGVPAGDNGQYYITAAAAARVDTHEWLHVRSSERHHNAIIGPLEQRVAAYTGVASALARGTNAAEAKTALTNNIDWNNTITAWAWADYNDNQPMMAVDQAELAAADFPRHLGPATVAGKAYADYLAMPGETAPAPAVAGGTRPPGSSGS